MKTITSTLLICLLSLCLLPNTAAATSDIQIVPCMIWKNGRWVRDGKKCRQFDEKQQRAYNKRLLKLKFYEKTFIPKAKKIEQDFLKLDVKWKIAEKLWEQQRLVYIERVKEQKANAQSWKDAFENLQKQKVPGRHWSEHPALWFTIGAVTVGGVVLTTVLVINAGK